MPARSLLTMRTIGQHDGWCDDPGHPAYNRKVRLPFRASHERLWREDRLYDICLVLDYNLVRRSRYRGSAIFFHLTGEKGHTEGCIAVSRKAMDLLLPRIAPGTRIEIIP